MITKYKVTQEGFKKTPESFNSFPRIIALVFVNTNNSVYMLKSVLAVYTYT